MRLFLLPLVLLGVLAGCARESTEPSPQAAPGAAARNAPDTLTGTVVYRERIALSPDAVVRVTLEDAGRAGAPSVVLAEATIPAEGRQVPIPFALAYDASTVQPGRRYVVRATIAGADGALRWTTDAAVPVLTNGAPAGGVEVQVRQVAAPDGQGAQTPGSAGLGETAPQERGQTAVFVCTAPDGTSFAVTTRTRSGELAVWLPERFGDRYLVLGQVRAASGAKYESDGVVVWNKGEEATIELDGTVYTGCRMDRARAIWEDARLRGADFRAVGNEPGWHLEILQEQRMHFVYAYGQQEVVTPYPDPIVAEGQTVYHAETEAHDLTVTIEDTACTDTMSGESFEATVTVEIDGVTYRGCGRALH